MELAWHFGESDVDAWLERLPLEMLDEWTTFINERPHGEHRDDRRIALLYEVLGVGVKRRGGGAVDMQDFLKRLDGRRSPRQSANEQARVLMDAFPSHKEKYAERDKRSK